MGAYYVQSSDQAVGAGMAAFLYRAFGNFVADRRHPCAAQRCACDVTNPDAGIVGMIEASPHSPMTLPESAAQYPEAILGALEVLREAGVNGPYALALGSESFKLLSSATEAGYPVRKRIEQQVLERAVLWAPAVPGAVLLSVRGGDFLLTLGADLSIGYAAHDRSSVDLYLVESLAFRVLDAAAAVHLRPAGGQSAASSPSSHGARKQ